MFRRVFLFALPCLLRADDRQDAVDALEPLTSAMSEGDAPGVQRAIPKDQEPLRANLLALVTRTEVTSSVSVVSVGGGSADLDWYMEIRNKTAQVVVERRRGRVRMKYRSRKLLALEPASFFAPPTTE